MARLKTIQRGRWKLVIYRDGFESPEAGLLQRIKDKIPDWLIDLAPDIVEEAISLAIAEWGDDVWRWFDEREGVRFVRVAYDAGPVTPDHTWHFDDFDAIIETLIGPRPEKNDEGV